MGLNEEPSPFWPRPVGSLSPPVSAIALVLRKGQRQALLPGFALVADREFAVIAVRPCYASLPTTSAFYLTEGMTRIE